MLAEDENQPLVPLRFQGQHLLADFVLVQRAANGLPVRAAERAILAIVRAVVADVERGEQHDAVAVHVALQLPGGVENLLDQLRLVGRQQHGGLLDRQRLLRQALGDDLAHLAGVRPAVQQTVQAVLVDEVVSAAAELGLSITNDISLPSGDVRRVNDHVQPPCRRHAKRGVIRRIAPAPARLAAEGLDPGGQDNNDTPRRSRQCTPCRDRFRTSARYFGGVRLGITTFAPRTSPNSRPSCRFSVARAVVAGMFARGHTSRAKAITL